MVTETRHIGNVTVTVLVEALPSAPFAHDDFADTVTDKSVNIDVLANDSDPSGGKPALIASPVCANGGDAVRTPDDRVTFTPPPGATGTFRCKYTVSNSQGLRAEASIIVSVTPAPKGNAAPTLQEGKLQQTIEVGQPLTLNAADLATDPDGDSLVFSSVSLVRPQSGSHNFTQKSASFTYFAPATTSADLIPGTDTLDVTISDGNDGNVRGTISIKIVDSTPPLTEPVHSRDPATRLGRRHGTDRCRRRAARSERRHHPHAVGSDAREWPRLREARRRDRGDRGHRRRNDRRQLHGDQHRRCEQVRPDQGHGDRTTAGEPAGGARRRADHRQRRQQQRRPAGERHRYQRSGRQDLGAAHQPPAERLRRGRIAQWGADVRRCTGCRRPGRHPVLACRRQR